MSSDPASLGNLRDIVAPPPVPWWPPAPGWWVACAVSAIVAAVVGVRVWRRWRANAYRRAALRELQSAKSVAAMAEVLKRTALCAYPRTQVASLTGPAWCKWLGESVGRDVPAPIAEAFVGGIFAREESANVLVESASEVRAFAIDWVNRHGNQTMDHAQRK